VAPDFTLRSAMDNTEVTLSAHRGQVVIMSFWATWCAPCLAEMPHLEQMYKDLGDHNADGTQDFTVLSISIDDARDRSKIKPLIRSKQLSFPVLWDRGSQVSSIYNPSGSAPLTIIIDQEGNLVETIPGYTAGEECEVRQKVLGLLGIDDPNTPEQCQSH